MRTQRHLVYWPAWISNHMSSKVWDEITYPYPNFNGSTIEVLEWISNFMKHFIMDTSDVITYPCWDLNHTILVKGTPSVSEIVVWASNHIPLQWRHHGHDSASNHQPHDYLINRLFGRRSKKTSKLRVTGLCVGNSPVTGEFPAQMASNAENVSIWWRHHDIGLCGL